ncbi:MAG TPA: hypothetical protein VK698_28375 [Kofleriaceae bacterium]|nr:hypothetical protein [Kofleriaceae bacterium]
MRTATILLLLATSTPAWAERGVPSKYLGGSVELSNGLASQPRPGFELQVALLEHLELELGVIHHQIDGDPFAERTARDPRDTWLVQGGARAKIPIENAALLLGLGVIEGATAVAAGCQSSGIINLCGDENGTLAYRRWDHAVWVRPELGAEGGFGPMAVRLTVAPLIQLAHPDQVEGCKSCDDGEPGALLTLSLHGRISL